MPTAHGEARMSGGAAARKLDPAILDKARAAVERADATVFATARFEDGKTVVRLNVAVPYEAPEGERTSTMAIDVPGNEALNEALRALLDERLPDLIYRGKRAAAESMIAAGRDAAPEDD